MQRRVLALDLGGTTIKLGVIAEGRVVARTRVESHSGLGIDQALRRLVPAAQALLGTECVDVGMAVPTFVDSRTSNVVMALKNKFDGLVDTDLAGWSRCSFGGDFRIENDAHAALLGEWRSGAGRGCENLVMVTVGTGIGTSVVMGNRALRGPHAQAGNFGGHFVIDPYGFDCACGNRGCIEAMQNVPALNSLARADSRYVASSLSNHDQIDYAILFREAGRDELARDLLNRSLDLWGALVVSMIHQFTPDRIIIGGGIIQSAEVILPHLQLYADRAMARWKPIHVVAAELGDDAALIGVASLFHHTPDFI